jgi:hypothetical protein
MNAPKPTALKVLQGTNRKDRANDAEPQPDALTAIPESPIPLTGHARKAWDRLAREAIAMRVLTRADLDSLALTCLALNDYMAARRDDVSWRRADAAWKRYMTALHNFGFDPSGRTRIHAAPASSADPLEALIKRKASG